MFPSNRTLFIADNLRVLRGMDSETVDLIATDPPFNAKRSFNAPLGSKAATQRFDDRWRWDQVTDEWHDLLATDHPAIKEVIEAAVVIEGGQVTDRGIETGVENSIAAFLAWLAPRVVEMRRILKPTGSLYLHCDDAANSYLRILLDAVFGRSNFRNEIVWKRTAGKGLNPTRYVRNCDRILYYAKGAKPIWNQQYDPFDPAYGAAWRKDERGPWEDADLTGGKAGGPAACKPFRGVTPSAGRAWAPPPRNKFPPDAGLPDNYESLDALSKCEALDDAGLIHWPRKAGGIPRYKKYLSTLPGIYASDLIVNIPPVSSRSREHTGWKTQKPLKLYRRIVEASTHEGDLVMDPFAGCATTCVAAEQLRRRWIGVDIDPVAETVTLDRLREETGLFEAIDGKPVTARKHPPRRSDIQHVTDAKLRVILWNNQGRRCANPYCTSERLRAEDLDLDHRIPKSRGGADDQSNRIGLCHNCNTRKGAKAWGKFLDEARARLPHPKVGRPT
ncbi:MAG: DNA methyltransferase [Cyanobacteria bacterium MAG CAR1_bin_15]|nr:DNA methyltransferase [Cyanobacteria bacterium MAG CAR1_bin_15]